MKLQEEKIFKINDNTTGHVRSLVLGFETMMTLGSGAELKMKKDFKYKNTL
jgi:hypothetical protein